MITCGTQVVAGSSGGGASLPAAPSAALLDAGAPSTMVGLNSSGVGEALSAAATRSRIGVVATPNATPSNIIAGATAGAALITDASGNAQAITGTSGYVLTSNGAGVAPTWQAASGGGTPARLIGAFTDANHFTRAATVAADAVGGAGYSWLVCGYLTTSTASLRKAWEYQTAGAGWGFIINGTSVQMYMAGINGGAGLSTPFNVGLTLTAGAAFAVVIEYVAGELRATLNGGTVAVTSLTGTFAPATAASVMGLGGDRVNAPTYAFSEGKLAECDMISGALGDSAIQAFALGASTTYSFASQFSQAQRAALKFSWVASDGGAPVRVGYGPLTTAGTLLASQPV